MTRVRSSSTIITTVITAPCHPEAAARAMRSLSPPGSVVYLDDYRVMAAPPRLKAKVPLLTAAETAVNANAGSRAVSIVPELKNAQATAEVTLLQGMTFKKVTAKLD